MLVARTDPDAPKHKGLTYFALDMHAPGVEVRPLRQITGEAEFNEVYLTEVRVPDADRIGDVGEGWRVAMTTLMNERTTIGGGGGAAGPGLGRHRRGRAHLGARRSPTSDRGQRDRLMQLWIEAEALRLTNIRAGQNRKAGNPGPEGSIAKLMFAEVNKRIYELCVDLLGADGLVDYDYEMRRAEHLGLVGPARVVPQDVPAVAGQLDRGRHVRDPAQHPRRAGARPARRAPRSTRSCPGRRCRAKLALVVLGSRFMAEPGSIAPATGKLGVLTPGLGAVASTFIAGVLSARHGHTVPIGSLTQMAHIRLGERSEGPQPADPRLRARSPRSTTSCSAAGTRSRPTRSRPPAPPACSRSATSPRSRPSSRASCAMDAVFDQRWVKQLDGIRVEAGADQVGPGRGADRRHRALPRRERLRPPRHGVVRLDRGLPGAVARCTRRSRRSSRAQGQRRRTSRPSQIYAYAALHDAACRSPTARRTCRSTCRA